MIQSDRKHWRDDADESPLKIPNFYDHVISVKLPLEAQFPHL